jgi:hypothetical protein
MISLYLMILLITAVACTVAVLHHKYDDTLFERLALSGAVTGAAVEFYSVVLGNSSHRGLVLMLVSLLAFGVSRALPRLTSGEDHVSGF